MCSCNIVLLVLSFLGLILIILGAVLGFAVFDNIVEDRIIESVRLEEGTEQYDRWLELPVPLTFKVYLFNVTNVEETMNGAKPIVDEVGPYVYKQYRQKFNVTYNGTEDTLQYKQEFIFEYDATATFPLSEDDVLTLLNVPLQAVLQNAGATPQVVSDGWPNAFYDTTTLFHEVSVKDYLFGGYRFCDPAVMIGNAYFLARLVCNQIRTLSAASSTLTITEDRAVEFSFFRHKNNSDDGTYVINAGMEDIHQLGAIQRWRPPTELESDVEFLDYLQVWVNETSTCNDIRGRDSSIYPPFNNDSSAFDIFNTDICRIVKLETTGTAEYKDVEGNVAKLVAETLSNTGDQSCYCTGRAKNLDGNNECLPEGFGDMTTCVGAPVIVSFPHLLYADQDYSGTIEGLKPDPDQHVTFVNIEPDTGTPLQGAKRIQFNMFIRPIDQIEVTQALTPAVLPILWVEEGINLSDDLIQQLKDDYLNMLVILDVVTWVLIGVGIAAFVGFLGFFTFRKC